MNERYLKDARRAKLNKTELWQELSEEKNNAWLKTKSPIAQHFLACVKLEGSKKERKDAFFASQGPDSSAISIAGEEHFWTQTQFNNRDKVVQAMFANNPEVTDAFIIKKFKRDLIEETFSGYKKSAKETEVREAETKSNKQATIFAIVFVLVSCAGIATCVNNSMETEYNDPACAKLGLKSNWNNTKCY